MRIKKMAKASLSTFSKVSREKAKAPSVQRKAILKGPETSKRTFMNPLMDLTMGEEENAGNEAEGTISQALATSQVRTLGGSEGIGPTLTCPTVPISSVFKRLLTPLPSEGYLEMTGRGSLEEIVVPLVKEILA